MAGSFSFDTPEEVMHVLASVRASGVEASVKSQLRDLILSYTNGGKDPSLKIQIEQQLSQHGIAPNAAPTTLSPVEQHDFGSSRKVPSFVSPTVTTPATIEAPGTPTTPSEPVVAETPVPVPVPTPKVSPATPVTPVTQVPQVTEPVAPKVADQTPEVVVPALETPAEPPVAVAPATTVDPLQRIREIKALVNEKVGNPVNLVDINNEVGREYMAALLEAMKKINAGAEGSSAMQRLEAAYASVEGVLKEKDASESSLSESAPEATPVPDVPSVTDPEEQKESEQTDTAVTSIKIRSSAPQPATGNETDDSASRWANTSIRMPEEIPENDRPRTVDPFSEVAETQPEVIEDTENRPLQPISDTTPDQSAPIITPIATPPVPPTPSPVVPPKPPATAIPAIKPLSKTGEPLKSVSDLPTADSLETSESGDPLFTQEVDDGLNQLLSDWVLFRKSGLLGTGPKGIQHPLYLKIKELQIPILLAGRFDGATQEIKQSITDYMNGWRYEQGIIYEQGETFEHYLRRVIRHILDLQK